MDKYKMMALVVRLGFRKKTHSFEFHLSSLTTGSFTGVMKVQDRRSQ